MRGTRGHLRIAIEETDEHARREIEALNKAFAIVMDDQLRAAHDVARETRASPAVWAAAGLGGGCAAGAGELAPVRIGSSADRNLVLPGRCDVSPEHAMICRRGDCVILHVTHPHAECQVNGNALTWARLDEGDEASIGSITPHVSAE